MVLLIHFNQVPKLRFLKVNSHRIKSVWTISRLCVCVFVLPHGSILYPDEQSLDFLLFLQVGGTNKYVEVFLKDYSKTW